MGFLKVLRIRHLAILWLSQVFSAMGDYFYEIAVIWIAIKTVGSGAGIVAAAESGAMLVFGLLGGVYADRWNRRKTMITVDVLRACTVLSLPIVAEVAPIQLWHLILIAIIVGSLSALFDPALQASLPALTEDTQTLQATNGLMDVTRRLARILGPGMAGVLIAFLPLTHFFTIDAISFGVSALAVFSLGRHFAWKPVPMQQRIAGIRGIWTEIAGAMRLVRAHRPLLWALVINGIINMLWSAAFTVGVPLLADRVLKGNVGAYGLIIAAYGVGNVISNLIVGSFTIRHRMVMVFTGKVIVGVGFILMASATTLPIALLGSAIAAIGGPMGDIVMVTMIQTDLPPGQLGKVYSLRMLMASIGASLGLLLAVPLFQFVSVPVGITLCACLMVVSGSAGLLRFGFSEPVVPALF
ncbi:MAG: MFS transporter [Chloroflexota bacterium]|nr:MFS transporter [Chloroflexota bacterium]